MKKVSKYLCFTLFIVILLFTGGKIQFYLDQQAELSFHMYPRIFSFVFFPFFIGGVLRFCQLINNKKNQHVWKFQLEKFIGIALPSALIGFSPILLFSPIGQFFPYLAYLAILTLLNTTFPVIINIIAGYSLLDSFIRKEN
ncbi:MULTISPECIES: hypothetical protein [Bacillus]|uniref:hypothetical protein n=1 Tax=Bacillus TaxID=1386 RepID=UPI00032FC8F7|nr:MULTISPECIES: hypothetical protein [Bacillus cereus group]EOP55054.1 hypothetical protein IIW_01188 [Bacillus cereus VD136]EOP73135.1 hypothetical protein KOW_00545 [Bacillus cereus VDM006]EOQ09247.1 hypothetical protein KOY_03216 [Bacillus cereus VDM021]MDF2083794.1 hypothetical protein [Bacillus pseudomycoides]PEL23841.1 hypothetical protein CN608_19330 [Bacillus pseudomycoides]